MSLLGILFHQYLCGELPEFDKSRYDYTFEAVLDDGNVKISNKVDSRFAGLIKRMLDKDPDKRPSVTEIFDELAEKPKPKPEPKPEPKPTESNSTHRSSRLISTMGKYSSGKTTTDKSKVGENTAEKSTDSDNPATSEKTTSFFKAAGDL